MKMMRSFGAALAGLAMLALAACATGPQYAYAPWKASISDPGEIYSSYEWGKEVEIGLTDAGRMADMEQVKAHHTEESWPKQLGDIDRRAQEPDKIKMLKGEVIAIFRNGDTPVAIFHAPAKDNTKLPEGWRPTEDIYIFVKEEAVSHRK